MRNQMENLMEDQPEKFFDVDGIIGTVCAVGIVVMLIVTKLGWI